MSTMGNSVMLIGRPKANPTINNDKATFDLVVTERVMNKQTQEWENETQSFRCVSTTKNLTDRINDKVRKGLQIAIDGKLRRVDNDVIIIVQDLFPIDRTNE